MSDLDEEKSDFPPSPESSWAKPVSRLTVSGPLEGGVEHINVDGREVLSPLQGFGQLWQKTYRIRLKGLPMTAAEVMQIWKTEFPRFQPADSRFHPPPEGIQPGSLMFIDLDLPVAPGLPSAIPVSSGVLILYADDVSFTVMTPQGFPVSGWNTFSVQEEEGHLMAQVQSIDRATDPIYEFGSMLMGGAGRQEKNWTHVLLELARRFDVVNEKVSIEKELLDSHWQWSEARNIWYNAGVRTLLHRLSRTFPGRKK